MQQSLTADVIEFVSRKKPQPDKYPLVYKALTFRQISFGEWTPLEELLFNSIYVIFAFLICSPYSRRLYNNIDSLSIRPSNTANIPITEWMKAAMLASYRNGMSDDAIFACLSLLIIKRRACAERPLDGDELSVLNVWISALQRPPAHFALVAAVYDYVQNTLSSIAPLARDPRIKNAPLSTLFVYGGGKYTAGLSELGTPKAFFRNSVTVVVNRIDCPDVVGRDGLKNPHILAFIQAPYGTVQNRITPAETRLEKMYTKVRGSMQRVGSNGRNTFRLALDKSIGQFPSNASLCFEIFYELGDSSGDYQSVANGSIALSSISDGRIGEVDMRTFACNSGFAVDNNIVTTPYQTRRDCVLFVAVGTYAPASQPTITIENRTPVNPQPMAMHKFFTDVYASVTNIQSLSQSIVYPCLAQYTAPISLVAYTEVPPIEVAYVDRLVARALNAFDIMNRHEMDILFEEAMVDKEVFMMAREIFVFMFNLGAEMYYLNDKLYGADADKFANARETNSGDCDDMGILGYQTLMFINKHPETFHGPIFDFSRAFIPAMVVVSAKSHVGSKHLMLHMITMMFPVNAHHPVLENIIMDGTVKCMNTRIPNQDYTDICRAISAKIFRVCEIPVAACTTNTCDKYEAILSVCSADFPSPNKYMRVNTMDAFGAPIYTPRREMVFLPISSSMEAEDEMKHVASLIPPVPEMDMDSLGDSDSAKQRAIETFMLGTVLLRKERTRSGKAYKLFSTVIFSLRSSDIRRNSIDDIKKEFLSIVSYCRSNSYSVYVQKYDILPTDSTFDVIVIYK